MHNRRRKSVLVIRVNMFDGRAGDAMTPLIVPLLQALTPPDWAFDWRDDRIEALPATTDADLVALSVETFAAKRAFTIAERYRSQGATVVMGGFHPSACPDECLAHCDAVLIGDAEDTYPAMLRDAAMGRLQPKYTSSGTAPIATPPRSPDPYGGKPYLRIGLLQTSRGCKFACEFCSIKGMYPLEVRKKPIEAVVAELRAMPEKRVFFVDDNLFYDEASALALFAAIAPLKKLWACQISLDAARNDALLAAMKRSGCFLVLIGFESLDPENLRQMAKCANHGDYGVAIDRIYAQGLLIYATFALGYDAETPASIDATLRFAQRMRFAIANFNPLIPMPGTPLYDRLEREGRLIRPAWWKDGDYRYGETVFQPARMTPEQLESACRDARYAFYALGSIWKRFFGLALHRKPGNALVFWLANWVSRREIHRKQGRRIGGEASETDAHQAEHRPT